MMIRVLIVNEIFLLCNVLSTVLEDEPDFQVIGSANKIEEAVRLAPAADIVLVDSRPTNKLALELIRSINRAGFPAKVIVLGVAESPEQVVHFVREGAAGYVPDDDSVDELLARIREIHAGRVKVSPRIAAALAKQLTRYAHMLGQVRNGAGVPARLTSREQEIIELIGQNMTNQQIAERLIIELGTVKNHVHNILQKLSTNNRREAAVTWAIEKRKD